VLARQGQRLMMLDKTAMFTEKQVVALTGISRKQLYNLSNSQTVQPHKNPILYTWKQVIFLRVFYILREDWSFQLIEKQFKSFPGYGIEKVIEEIDSSLAVIISDENDGDVRLGILAELTFGNKFYNRHFKKAIENIKTSKPLNYEEIYAVISYVINDADENEEDENDEDKNYEGEENFSYKITIKKQTILLIPEVIRELTKAASKLNIENFDLKVS
jgi:hypothetical protein